MGTNHNNSATPEGVLSPSIRTCFAIVLIMAEVINIIGNFLVIMTVAVNSRLRTCTNFFITNLSVVDLLAGFILIPTLVHKFVTRRRESLDMLCQFFAFFDSLYGIASSLTIAAIALDRYHSIVNCLRYEIIVTQRKTTLVIFWIWLQAILFSTFPFLGWGKFYLYPYQNHYKCSWRVPDKNRFIYIKTVSCVLLPFAITAFCYIRIHLVARRHARTIVHIQICDASNRVKSVPSRKARMVFLMVGVYIVCWVPLYLLKIIMTVDPTILEEFIAIATVLSYINSSCNPIMYALITSQFRNGMTRLYRRVWRCVLPDARRREERQTCAKRDSRSSWTPSRTPGNIKRYFNNHQTERQRPPAVVSRKEIADKKERVCNRKQAVVGSWKSCDFPLTLQIPNEQWQNSSKRRGEPIKDICVTKKRMDRR